LEEKRENDLMECFQVLSAPPSDSEIMKN